MIRRPPRYTRKEPPLPYTTRCRSLLRQITDGHPLAGPGFAGKIGVDAGHKLHHRRLAGAVRADNADLGVGVELHAQILERRLLRAGIGLVQTLHHETILGGHGICSEVWRGRSAAGRVARRLANGGGVGNLWAIGACGGPNCPARTRAWRTPPLPPFSRLDRERTRLQYRT